MSRVYSKRSEPSSRADNGDQLPPHSVEAERGVLGCVMLSPESSMNECEEFGVQGDWFYDLRHKLIFEVMEKLWKGQRSPSPRPSPPGEGEGHAGTALNAMGVADGPRAGIDVITVVTGLKSLAEAAGTTNWWELVASLPDEVPSAVMLPDYLGLLRELWQRRGLLRVCTEAAGQVQSVKEPVGAKELLGMVEKEVQRLAEAGEKSAEVQLRVAIATVMQGLEDYHRGQAQIEGLTTGLSYLDKILCGFGGENGNAVVWSGRPGTGKTSLAVQIAMHVACDFVWWDPILRAGADGRLAPVLERVRDGEGNEKEKFKCERRVGKNVGIFSMEMASKALVKRMLFQRAGADMQRWRTGFALADTNELLMRASKELARPENVLIDDTGRMSIDLLRGRARRWGRQENVGLIVVDYVQLMRPGGRSKRQTRREELEDISGELQALGKELNVPFLILAQMSRTVEMEAQRQPRLSDLKDCGAIEQDADVVGFLYRPKLRPAQEQIYEAAMDRVYQQDWAARPIRVNALVAKNRYGPSDKICELLFQKSCTRFMDYREWLREHGAAADETEPLPNAEGEES